MRCAAGGRTGYDAPDAATYGGAVTESGPQHDADVSVPPPDATAVVRPRAHPMLRYTGLRALLLVAAVAVGALVPVLRAQPLALLLAAFLVSGAVSYVVLDRPRNEAAASVSGVLHRINDRIDASARAEDDDLDDLDDGGAR